MSKCGVWSGGKGSIRRPGKDPDINVVKALGCNWCPYYFAYKKLCMLLEDERKQKCPKLK